jgi:basic membrane lipoprotein Med (substrate-binding protein (PBP1-ABC) superfamily)/DNA-binding SARP family transcriptional activator
MWSVDETAASAHRYGQEAHRDSSDVNAYARVVRFEVLGRVRAFEDGVPGHDEHETGLGGPKQQLVLALLLAQPNSTIPADVLVEQIWGDSQPSTARHTMQGYISELRKALGPVVERSGAGYVVRVDRTSLDSLNFEALVSEGQSVAGTDPEAASDRLAEALGLWRDDPFLGLDDRGSLTSEVGRLAELRLVALESRVSMDLELGRHGELVGELEALTNDFPFREEFRAQHMIALYRSGRQAEALRAYQRTRVALAEELGIEASPKLRRLEEQILVQDPALDLAVEADPTADPLGPIHNPYKGLRAFSEADADDFFGRARLIGQLAAAVDARAPLVTVVGPSGSGKSSAVHAGLLPALRSSAGLMIASMLPGTDPYVELEAALLRSVDGSPATLLRQLTDGDTGMLRAVLRLLPDDADRLVLVIDQFEELFTLVEDGLRAEFLAALVTAASDPRGRVQVVFTLRADFYDRPLMHPEFGQLMTGNVINVTPLAADELEVAALGPAQRMGIEFEAGLLAEVLADVAGQPNALPLFQYALTELFDRREESTLTLAAYRGIGGLQKAVATRAEETYRRLGAEQQEAALQLFLRLVTVGDHAETRRRVSAAELISLDIDPVAMQGAVEAFAGHRLLTLDRDPFSGAPTVEVAHEALLTEWERLRGWIVENREYLVRLAALNSAVDEWLTADRDPDFLLSGGRLDLYTDWRAQTPTRLTANERDFLDQGIAQRTAADAADASQIAEAERLRRRARRTTFAFAGLALVVLVAAVAVVIAVDSDEAQPTVAIFSGLDADDDQVGELYAQGITRVEQDLGISIERIDLLLPEDVILSELTSDLVVFDSQLSNILRFEPELRADLNPDTHYVTEDIPPAEAPEGMTNIIWAHEEGGFLAGAAAAATTETGTVGYVGSTPLYESFQAGFEAGVHWVDEDIEILAANLVDFGTSEPFTDQEKGKEVAALLYGEGADIIFHAAGAAGFGVFEAAEQLSDDGKHLWAIGVDTDQWQTASAAQRPHILSSVIKRVGLGVYTVVSEFVDGTLELGSRTLGVANEFMTLSRTGGLLSAEALRLVEQAEVLISSGEIEVPTWPRGPMVGPAADTSVTAVFDGETCAVQGPSSLPSGVAFGFELVNDSDTAATLLLTDWAGGGILMSKVSAGSAATAGHSAVAMGDLIEVFCIFGPAFDQNAPWVPADPIPVD